MSFPWRTLIVAGPLAGMLACFLAAMAPLQARAQTASATVVSTCGGQSFTAGQTRSLNQDTGGQLCGSAVPIPSSSAAAGIAPVASTVAEACHVLKASAGNLYSVSGYIGAAGFIMVFDSPTAPADGAVTPVVWAYVGAAGSWSVSYRDIPAYFLTGITVCASSTGPLTKTAYSTNTVFSGQVK